MNEFLIVTVADDLHGLSVQASLRRRKFECHILESDKLMGNEALTFSICDGQPAITKIRSSDGRIVDASSIGVIWWRRPKALQQLDGWSREPDHLGLINNDCTTTLIGSLQNSFLGKWISSPRATEFSSNKLNQLAAASRCGFRIPETLVTQVPAEVRSFYQRHAGRVIVKPVAGTPGPLLFTQFVQEAHLEATESIRVCPAIYQEFIPGTRHIRLNCFGEHSYAGLIESEALDWRPNLKVPIMRWGVPNSLHVRIRQVLDLLGLDMGIIDLKEMPSGEIVWLEVNPQGQFLFLEGLTGEPLTEHFSDYLIAEMDRLLGNSRADGTNAPQRDEIVSSESLRPY